MLGYIWVLPALAELTGKPAGLVHPAAVADVPMPCDEGGAGGLTNGERVGAAIVPDGDNIGEAIGVIIADDPLDGIIPSSVASFPLRVQGELKADGAKNGEGW